MKDDIPARTLLHRMLFGALIEFRYNSFEKDMAIYKISNLLHNLPLQLERVAEGQDTYENVLQQLMNEATASGMEGWFKIAEANAQQMSE